ncbi:MAG: hypothetical protein WBQ75_20530 [Acetobacteraceae bacterium]
MIALAERGSAWSMLLVGWAYQTGEGVTADPTRAERWYRLAFEAGVQQAQLRLGRIYADRSDFAGCEEVYGVGSTDRWAPAMFNLAMIKLRQPRTPERLEAARILLEQASVQGDLGAQLILVQFLRTGCFGLRRIPRGFVSVRVRARRSVQCSMKMRQ